MSTNDPVLEVLRAMRGDLGLVTTELGRLVRHAEYATARLDSVDRRLEGIDARFETLDARFETVDDRFETLDARFETLEQHSAATVTALGVLNAAVQAIVPALEQGRLREDDRLRTRVDECERRIDALEQDR